MAINSRWKREYDVLRDYVVRNPEIHIDLHEVCIPERLRSRFYGYFDNVRRSVIRSWDGPLFSDACSLAKNYTVSEKKLSETLNLSIELPQDQFSFLHDPEEGMMRLIYNRLFELVQGKMSEDDFGHMAESDLVVNATEMFQLGYEAWVALTLILLLDPDEIFGVILNEKSEPRVTGIDAIAFGRQFHHPANRIPEFILHSRKLDRYVAFKMPLAREVASYVLPAELPTQRLLRNRNGDSSAAIGHRMIFLSVVPNLEKPPVFANLHQRSIHGPDVTIECADEQDLLDTVFIGQAQNRVGIMKPRMGGIMVLMNPVSKSEPFSMEGNIDAFPVGLDRSRLQPVVNKMI